MFSEEDTRLIAEFGLQKLPEATQHQVLEDFYAARTTNVAMALEDRLDEKQLAAFEQKLQAGGDAVIEPWLRTIIADYDEIVARVDEETKARIRRTMTAN